MHYHRIENYQKKNNMKRVALSFKEIFNMARDKMLRTEHECGLRSSPLLSEEDSKIFDSIIVRYLSYVNPLERLSRVLFDNLSNSHEEDKEDEAILKKCFQEQCNAMELKNKSQITWKYDQMIINNCLTNSSSGEESNSSNTSNEQSSEEIFESLSMLAKRLAQQYPTKEERTAYYSLLNEKFEILTMKALKISPSTEKYKDRIKRRSLKRKRSIPQIEIKEIPVVQNSCTISRSKSDCTPLLNSNNFIVDTEKFYHLARPHSTNACGVSWEDRLMTDRFNALIEPLTKDQKILYNTIVKKVDYNTSSKNDHCKVITQNRETQEIKEFFCRHVICTLPVGVLKGLSETSRVSFSPEIPSAKRKAIENLGIPCSGAENHEKVILRFSPDEIFWDSDAVHLKCPDPRFHILNLHRYGKTGILCAHIWGGSGMNTSNQTDAQIIEILMELFYKMYPNTCTNFGIKIKPISYIITRWSSDPFSLGSYTSGEPESDETDRFEYAKTLFDRFGVPRLFFAGEATLNSEQAKECTHGAMITGLDRSFELIEYLAKYKLLSKKNLHDPITLESYFSLIKSQLAKYLLDKNGRYSFIDEGCRMKDKRKQRQILSNSDPDDSFKANGSDTDPCTDEACDQINLPNQSYLKIITEEDVMDKKKSEFEFCKLLPTEISLQLVK